jgi:hypothetical protein
MSDATALDMVDICLQYLMCNCWAMGQKKARTNTKTFHTFLHEYEKCCKTVQTKDSKTIVVHHKVTAHAQ